MTSRGRVARPALAVALMVLILDQTTKQWALSALAAGPIDVVWTLRFRLVFNPGMAFSQGQSLGPLIGLLTIIVIGVILVSLWRGSRWGHPIALGVLVGGAAGNLTDRLVRGRGWLRGEVVDFIDFQWFPVFNVADIAINVAVALLLIEAFRGRRT